MKLRKRVISGLALAAILGLTNIGTVSAQNVLEEVSTGVKIECAGNHLQKPCKCKSTKRNIVKQSVKQLEKDGTLSKEDISNIKEFRKKEKQEVREKILKYKCRKVDQMVKEEVITKEQGTKLKETMEKNLNNLEK